MKNDNRQNKQNLNHFPYVDQNASSAKFNKEKFPYEVKDEVLIKMYGESGHEVIGDSDKQEGYRFNVATRKLLKPLDGGEYTNKVTSSKPSSEVICVRKVDEDVQICLTQQPRTPYIATVNGKQYARFFIEQPAGLLENGETFEEAAIREVREETGYEAKELHRLISPYICRHVSYTDETSVLFYANLGEFKGQELDENEDIKVTWYPLEKVEEEFEDYMEGRKDNFFGLDIPEMTMLGLQRFFVKWHRGEISI